MHAGDVTHVAVLIGHGGGEGDVFVAQFEFFLSLVPQAEIEVGVKELALQTWSGGAIGFGLARTFSGVLLPPNNASTSIIGMRPSPTIGISFFFASSIPFARARHRKCHTAFSTSLLFTVW